jgi:aminoglycoside phosphotransferase (APT) family kinase protein
MSDPNTSVLDELRAHVSGWYPDLAGDVTLSVIDHDSRMRSQLLRVRVAGRGAPERTVVVKHAPEETLVLDGRPRLVEPSDPPARLVQEFEALDLVARRFAALDDGGLGAVRPLGLLPMSGALAMEEYPGRPLHATLIPGFVRQSTEVGATRLVRRAGRWLRAFHDLPTRDRPVRQGSRAEVAEAFQAVGRYLVANGAPADIEDVVRTGVRAVTRLPEPPPLAICHGDFAPRNILVDRTGRIAVIDISVRWLAPIYEDLASLLVGLRTNRANALTHGLVFGPAVRRLEPAFLDGYFGGAPIPRAAIRVYELLLVLDKWSSRMSRATERPARPRLQDRAIDDHFAASSRLLARRLTRLR